MSTTALRSMPSLDLARTSPEQVRVETVTDFRSFLALQPLWDSAVEESSIDHPFCSHFWLRSWWESFGDGKSLHIQLAYDGERCIGIAPMMAYNDTLYGLPVRKLEIIGNVHTPRSDLIYGDRAGVTIAALWNQIKKSDWDVLVLPQIPHEGATSTILAELAHKDGYLPGTWNGPTSPWLSLEGDYSSYLASLPRKHRSNIRNRARRLERLGPVDLEVIENPTAEDLTEGIHLEGAAWKGQRGTAISSSPEVEAFYRRLADAAANAGLLSLQFLRSGQRRIAFAYSMVYKDQLFLLKQGYDPSYGEFSPATLMLTRLLEYCFAQKLRGFDFLGTDEPWKRTWTPDGQKHDWLFVFSPSLKGRALWATKFELGPRIRASGLYENARDLLVRLRHQ